MEAKTTNEQTSHPDKRLQSLCNYYLNCISLENSNNISFDIKSSLQQEHRFFELSRIDLTGSEENIPLLIHSLSYDKRLTSYVGYPVIVSRKSSTNHSVLTPVFLFPITISGGAVSISELPIINLEAIRQYSQRDKDSQIYDLINLGKDLGLNDNDCNLSPSELVAKLQQVRQWQWREPLDPNQLTTYPPISTVCEEGVYNHAICLTIAQSSYTVGLENELSVLANLTEASYRDTALFDWIHDAVADAASSGAKANFPLLEVFPMNTEQEAAIRHALTQKLTIVTGPPGTGKSQVVANLLTNAAWNKKSVLFSSKNNKAVDVVEKRVNSLCSRPVMLRLGNDKYANRLAELVTDCLSYNSAEDDKSIYKQRKKEYQLKLAEYNQLFQEKARIVRLRNSVDHAEQAICALRKNWEKWFRSINSDSIYDCDAAYQQYRRSYHDFQAAKNSFFSKLFWFISGKRKESDLIQAANDLNSLFEKYELPAITIDTRTNSQDYHCKVCEQSELLLKNLRNIDSYLKSLQALSMAPSLETLDHELSKSKQGLAGTAKELWKSWLLTCSTEVDRECRKDMSNFITAMKLSDGNCDSPTLRKKFKSLQEKMQKYLPCVAVTSLSASHIPFKAGLYDMVIIDEASQCDIASVLPLLYRAKQAVILGDQQQLSHICSLSATQDARLLEKYGIDLRWSYSACSLYSVAASMIDSTQAISLRDHHRSHGDIIGYSNTEFYKDTLRIATAYDRLVCPKNVSAGIHWVDIAGQSRRPQNGGALNYSEVKAVVSNLVQLVLVEGYRGSIGVVTPFRAQADQIRKEIDKFEALRLALVNNKFLVDTVHAFQGDERDLMLFSTVISDGISQSSLRFLAQTQNLFNVAVSRARAVLIVIGNETFCSHCGIRHIEDFVSYVRKLSLNRLVNSRSDPAYPLTRAYPDVPNPEQVSGWERYFYSILFDHGIHVIPQYPVEKYKLDFAIIAGSKKLDIEIDGEMYHRDWNDELCYRDQLRNQRLFELGWDVKRFWVYQICDELAKCIEEIKLWLREATTP